MADTAAKGIVEYATIRYIEPGKSKFARTPGGFLSLTLGDNEVYPRVNLHRAFPFSDERHFISVRDLDSKEIGIIKDMDDFPAEIIALFEEQINRRYFAPVILRINTIKEEFGYSYWDVTTDAGDCRFTVRGGSSSVVNVGEDHLLVIDVDGNRFEIPDYKELDDKSFKKLDVFL